MELLRVSTRLGLPLLGGSKLRAHVPSQPGLLDKAIPLRLLLMEELGFVSTTSNKDMERRPALRNTKTQALEERGKQGRTNGYLASRNEDFTQDPSGLFQGIHHGRKPDVKTLPLHALGMIVEREKSGRWVLSDHPLERRLAPRRGAKAP